MRKIEREMIEAIKARKNYSNDNTQVKVEKDETIKVYLHSNLIARIYDNNVWTTAWFSDAEFQTKTTKSRLNCLLNHYHLPTICQKNSQWYIGDLRWDGPKMFQILDSSKPKEFDAVLGGQSQQPQPYDAVLGGKR